MAYRPVRPTTIVDVAERAQVSKKTVSRVINNEPGVNALTRAKVVAIIEEMHFRPNMNARGLAGDRSFLIGMFFASAGSYVADIQVGITARCREGGFYLMTEEIHEDDPGLAEKIVTLVRQLRLEGVILLCPLCDNSVILKALADNHVPMVRVSPRLPFADAPVVRTDDYTASRLMTRHLVTLGHQTMGFILGSPGHASTEQRYQGFRDELAAHNLPFDDSLTANGAFQFHQGLTAAECLLRRSDPPSAIVACNDDVAVAALAFAHRAGLRVPEDVSITGFDDTSIASMTWPQISTVRQPVLEIGREAAGLIIDHSPRRNGWPAPMPHRLLDFEIVLRESTAPANSARRRLESGTGSRSIAEP